MVAPAVKPAEQPREAHTPVKVVLSLIYVFFKSSITEFLLNSPCAWQPPVKASTINSFIMKTSDLTSLCSYETSNIEGTCCISACIWAKHPITVRLSVHLCFSLLSLLIAVEKLQQPQGKQNTLKCKATCSANYIRKPVCLFNVRSLAHHTLLLVTKGAYPPKQPHCLLFFFSSRALLFLVFHHVPVIDVFLSVLMQAAPPASDLQL